MSNQYDINDCYLSTNISFRLLFYSFQGCNPKKISNSFTKQYIVWCTND